MLTFYKNFQVQDGLNHLGALLNLFEYPVQLDWIYMVSVTVEVVSEWFTETKKEKYILTGRNHGQDQAEAASLRPNQQEVTSETKNDYPGQLSKHPVNQPGPLRGKRHGQTLQSAKTDQAKTWQLCHSFPTTHGLKCTVPAGQLYVKTTENTPQLSMIQAGTTMSLS